MKRKDRVAAHISAYRMTMALYRTNNRPIKDYEEFAREMGNALKGRWDMEFNETIYHEAIDYMREHP